MKVESWSRKNDSPAFYWQISSKSSTTWGAIQNERLFPQNPSQFESPTEALHHPLQFEMKADPTVYKPHFFTEGIHLQPPPPIKYTKHAHKLLRRVQWLAMAGCGWLWLAVAGHGWLWNKARKKKAYRRCLHKQPANHLKFVMGDGGKNSFLGLANKARQFAAAWLRYRYEALRFRQTRLLLLSCFVKCVSKPGNSHAKTCSKRLCWGRIVSLLWIDRGPLYLITHKCTRHTDGKGPVTGKAPWRERPRAGLEKFTSRNSAPVCKDQNNILIFFSFYIEKFSHKIMKKNLIWKYSETATPWVFDWTWWNLASQVRPNVPSTNLSSIPPTFVWIVNFIFSCVHKWNDFEIKIICMNIESKKIFKKIKTKFFKLNFFF